jgi:hypothetical protein
MTEQRQLHLAAVEGATRPTIDDLRPYATCSAEVTAGFLDLSRGSTYAAIRRGEIPSLRFGNRIVVPVPRLLELVGLSPETPVGD